MKRVLREPLVHFLLLGAALLGAYYALNRGRAAPPEDITVSVGQVENLATGFGRVWQRPPTQAEMKDLIDGYVKEEILSREAIKLGLDQNDTVIRRRLQQKMEFIAEDLAAAAEPTDAELAEYLATHAGEFAVERRFTFRQVFLDRERHGDRLDADVAAMLARLRQDGGADISELGDSLLLPQEYSGEPQQGVAAQFGAEFAAGLAQVPTGQWSGPIPSGFGVHLVLVTERTEGRPAALEEVRDRVKRELLNARRREANQKFLDGLLARYRVTIERPPPEPTQVGAAATVTNR